MSTTVPTPVLLLVNGAPCTGKTTLATRLAGDLGWPLVYKDGIKERLFDALGWGDRDQSIRLSHASYALLYYFIECQLAAGRSLIAESNFVPRFDTDKLRRLQAQHPFHPLQVHCHTDRDVLIARFHARKDDGTRHPGHVDDLFFSALVENLDQHNYNPMDLDGPVLRVDTTDFDALDYEALLTDIRAAVHPG
ncbi:MAG: ATP-binding protein [Anaerolineae bacterium]|nr:ATP-binding protein [Anaerolineae bacterium]